MRANGLWIRRLCVVCHLVLLVVAADFRQLGSRIQTNEVIPGSESVEAEDDLHQLANRPPMRGWSAWSDWSACSRTCESGIRRRLRRCLDKRCEGESMSYELCNVRSCPPASLDFRAVQCGKFNKERYKNHLYDEWLPVENRQEPCVLMCKARLYGITVKFSPKVIDGTRCNDKSRDVCIEGKCVEVGCDNVLGSSKRIDDCGICGGDGTACGRPIYNWRDTNQFSECTKTCGANSWRVSVSACFNEKTGRMVPENLCADKARPRPQIKECPHEPCPEEWNVGMWQPCNATCGGGYQQRDVFCVEHYNNSRGVSEIRPVANQLCWRSKKPDDWRQCNSHQCPIWEKGEWSTCSVTCGKGVQYRKVACRQERYTELSAYACDPKDRPEEQQPCYAGVSCEEAERNRLLDYERYRYVAAAPYTQWDDGGGGGGDRMRGALPRPHWSKGPWRECSTTCGPGVQNRQVKCVAIQPFTQTVMVLATNECEDKTKPSEFQPCEIRQCPMSALSSASQENQQSQSFINNGIMGTSGVADNADPNVARWEYGDWDKCSATCLGGYQSRILKCVNVGSGREVAWSSCNAKQRPVNVTRQCATEPCPPQWQIGQWSVCSHSCGGGLRTREVRCIQIHRSGDVTNTLFLTPSQCAIAGGSSERPKHEEPCAMENCPPYWNRSSWGECSRTCGEGQQHRVVVCEQLVVGGEKKRYNPPTPCQSLEKPPTVQLCSLGLCPATTTLLPKPHPYNSNPDPVGGREGSSSGEARQEYRFKIGGQAKVYEGSRLKIKCPVKNFDRAKITWLKDGLPLKPISNVKVSERGALRITSFSSVDAAIYTCNVGGSVQGNITLRMKPLDDRMTPETDISMTPVGKSPFQKQKGKGKGPMGPGKGKGKGKAPIKAPGAGNSNARITEADGYVVEPPPSGNVDNGGDTNRFEAPVLLPNNKLEAGKSFVQELERLRNGEQRDTVLPVNGSFPRASSLSLMEELKRYLLNHNKLDIYQALSRANNINSVKFTWMEGPWSPCSRSCREGTETGMQTRSVRCKVNVEGGYETYVVEDVCVRAGMAMPHEANLCGVEPCPTWVAGNWTDCEKGRCLRYLSAIKRREVHCVFSNATVADSSYCSDETRPSTKSECWNPRCVAVWRAANWSACTKTCGEDGVRMRTVQCAWNGTRKAAGNMCRGDTRPKTVSYCAPTPPCPPISFDPSRPFDYGSQAGSIKSSHCVDFSKYCPVAKMMGYCATDEYRTRCCLSCSVLSDYKRHYDENNAYLMDSASPAADGR